MDDLLIILNNLEDAKLDYVIERSRVRTDSDGIRNAQISRSTFYSWEDRESLNDYAQQLKRRAKVKAQLKLEDAVDEAAQVKVNGLRSRKESIQQAASTEILDRVIGKTVQKQEIYGKDGGPVSVIAFETVKPDNAE